MIVWYNKTEKCQFICRDPKANRLRWEEVLPIQEPEVSLRIAMKYIQDNETDNDVAVSIDGAHIKTKGIVHFDLVDFMRKNGYIKCEGHTECWQGEYQSPDYPQRIIISSRSGMGDVAISLKNGRMLYIESKKLKKGNGGEYPAMREAIGQLMTGCPIPVVAVPHSDKSEELARKWSCKERIRNAGIRFMLVRDSGIVEFI